MTLFPDHCERCGVAFHGPTHRPLEYSISYFDLAEICLPCRDDEKRAPNYEAAVMAEQAAFMAGQRNFPGIGLSDDDAAFLAARRAARAAQPSVRSGGADGG